MAPRHSPVTAASADTGVEDDREETASYDTQIWEHVKTLRKRVAGFN
jgi:hypothetical protein